MAAVLGDYPTAATISFPDMISTTTTTTTHQQSFQRSSPNPRFCRSGTSTQPTSLPPRSQGSGAVDKSKPRSRPSTTHFPSPPSSSSESLVDSTSQYEKARANMAPEAQHSAPSQEPLSTTTTVVDDSQPAAFAADSIPSPASDSPDVIPSPTLESSKPPPCKTIVVRDLKHIHELAKSHDLGNGPGILNEPTLQTMKYDISSMPIHDIIEMVAALLTKITTTNDLQHDAMSRNATHQQHASSHNQGQRELSPFGSSVLAFHGKNVPAISILSYLARIHKYCPTTYEVFLSLLVYFDRMTERVNEKVMKSERERQQRQAEAKHRNAEKSPSADEEDAVMHEASDEDLADEEPSPAGTSAAQPTTSGTAPATYFVVDSFNIHRLIIAGVTCASKFFSDIFYTNSRYAKVGGLPLNELNHLEVQFLILNDFRLFVAVEDLEAYATMLVEFYAREEVSKKNRRSTGT